MDDDVARTRGDAVPEEAELVELAAPAPAPDGWRRVKAGLLVELGRADRRLAARHQDAVVEGTFDPDRAAAEILAAAAVPDDDPALVRRCADLERDLLMAPRLRGVHGAARKAREAGRRGLAYLLVQVAVVAVFASLFAAGLLAARYAGHDLHAPIDEVLSWVGLEPGAGDR